MKQEQDARKKYSKHRKVFKEINDNNEKYKIVR